jgi:CubicO group peptidase (beta-lactamase class C family)
VRHLLVQQGRLDLHAPVARYWPESAAGKAEIPVRWLLSHQAGLPVIDRSLSVADVLAWGPVGRVTLPWARGGGCRGVPAAIGA